MYCLIEYILHFLFYGICTLFSICIHFVLTYIVTLKSTLTYVNLGLWAILVMSGKSPQLDTIVQSWKSHQIHRSNSKKRHCLFSSFVIHFLFLRHYCMWSVLNCELQSDVYLLESKCFKYSV